MNQVEATLTGDYGVVDEVVRRYVPRFAAHGFEFTGVTIEGSPKLPRFPIFHFLNKRTGMRIGVSFSAAVEGRNGGFTVLIINPVNRKLNVNDYLKLHGREELSKFFTYRDPPTDIRSFADSFLQMLCGLLDQDLKPIVDGKTFEETPIDWMGYK
jgi:hypothetical protein